MLVVTPAYNRPTQEGLYLHFAAAAEAARKPIILYNVPSRTAVDMLPATVGRLSQLPGIVSVKEAVTEPGRVRAILAASGKDFVVLSGDDATARRAMQEGARGVISVTANVAPRGMADMIAAGLRGDHAAAEKLDAPLVALHRDLFIEAESDPGQVGAGPHGVDGGGHSVATHAVVGSVTARGARRAAGGRGITRELSWRAAAPD